MAEKKQRSAGLARQAWRLLAGLLVALAGTYWVGREFGLSDSELLGYLVGSVGLVVAAALVGLVLFCVIVWLRR